MEKVSLWPWECARYALYTCSVCVRSQAIARHMPLHAGRSPYTRAPVAKPCVYELARILHTIRGPDRQRFKLPSLFDGGANPVRIWGMCVPNRFMRIDNHQRLLTMN